MITNLHKQLANRRDREQGSAFIFAVLLIMVMTLTVVMITATTLSGATTSKELLTRDLLRQAADAGLNNALLIANQGGTTALAGRIGSGNAFRGTMATASSTEANANLGLSWRWYTQRVSFPGEGAGFYVYSIGYSTTPGMDETVTLRSQFRSTNIASASYTAGDTQIAYEGANPWESGISGLSSVTVHTGAKVYVGDSNFGPNETGTNSTGTILRTNNGATLGTGTGVKTIIYGANRPTATCTGGGCASVGQSYRGADYSTKVIADIFTAGNACPPGTTYPVWRASENGGVLNLPDNSCVRELIFDVNTTVPLSASKTNPIKIYNTGSTTVWKGVRVNTNNVPLALQIYSNGSLSIGDPANVAHATNATRAQFEFASRLGSCHIYNTATLFGSLNCANVTLASGSKVYIDLATKELTSLNGAARKVWDMTYTEEL